MFCFVFSVVFLFLERCGGCVKYNGYGLVNCFFTNFGEVYVAVGVMDVTNDVKPRVEMYTWWILIWFVVLCALLS